MDNNKSTSSTTQILSRKNYPEVTLSDHQSPDEVLAITDLQEDEHISHSLIDNSDFLEEKGIWKILIVDDDVGFVDFKFRDG